MGCGGGGGGGRDQTCVKPFSQDRGCSRAFGGGGFNGWWASKVGESDGGGRGEIGLFFAFLFVGDIIISIQKRGEGESQE